MGSLCLYNNAAEADSCICERCALSNPASTRYHGIREETPCGKLCKTAGLDDYPE